MHSNKCLHCELFAVLLQANLNSIASPVAVTPMDYEPPGFKAAESESFTFEDKPMKIRAGDVSTVNNFFFFFLLFHQLADNEALIIFLQKSLFLVFPYAIDNCMSLSSESSLTLSIHLFLCLSQLLSPLTCLCSTAFGILFPSILSTCPNHESVLLIFSITVSSTPSSSLVFSLLNSFYLCFFSTTPFLPRVVLSHLPSSVSSTP